MPRSARFGGEQAESRRRFQRKSPEVRGPSQLPGSQREGGALTALKERGSVPALLSRVELAQQFKESVVPRSPLTRRTRAAAQREWCVPALLSRVELAQQLKERVLCPRAPLTRRTRAAAGRTARRRRPKTSSARGQRRRRGRRSPPPGRAREREEASRQKNTNAAVPCVSATLVRFEDRRPDVRSHSRDARDTRTRVLRKPRRPSLSLSQPRSRPPQHARHRRALVEERSRHGSAAIRRRRPEPSEPPRGRPIAPPHQHQGGRCARTPPDTRAQQHHEMSPPRSPHTSSERRTTHSCATRSCVRDRSARPIHTARAPETTHDVSRSSSRCHTRARDPFERIRSPTVIALERNHSPTAIHSNGTVLRPQYPFERDRSPTAIHSNGTVLRPRYPFERDHSPTAISIRTNPNLLEEGALARGGHGEEAADERVEGLHVALSRPLLASREAMRSLRGTLPALPAHLRVALSQLLLVSR